jgi:hypothetical protein
MSRSDPARLSVAASPLNPVKLDLGVILWVAALLWLVLSRIGASATLQILALAGFSCAGMVWLLARTRAVVRKMQGRMPGDVQEGL